MFEHTHKIRVRYAETDQMGIVHHSRYALYLEEARTECMREMGIPYNELEKEGIILPLVSMQNRFIASATYDDVLEIKTIVKAMPEVRFSIDYEIYRNNQLINTSNTTLVFVNKSTMKPMKCPNWINEKFSSLFT